ncbi:baseplate J protein [Ammoniphilus oxalaticus]|uniref:Baseplate J protein n=1 Tax=Ammoniphilus oxalaticus TaxID=66863 RepID=A0A419SFI1_9BACL|nr:baseplate J/gp47 family protein [Ammoniphilus oxalaticus]RKD22538.1 baseplate J protein [Ammoniphilus oxalaticus]
MFSHKTFDSILKEMLDRVPENVDKREGSIIYDSLAPTAMELAEAYANMDLLLRRVFADTADGEDLDRRVAERGVYRKEATFSIRKVLITNADGDPHHNVPAGSRFFLGDISYEIIEMMEPGSYQARSGTAGSVGNHDFGDLLPTESIQNLGRAELKEVLIPGEDGETDDSLRQRYFENVRLPATSGNKAHYEMWAKEIPGVGDAKAFPLWDGPGTVKVVIVNTEKKPADPVLVSATFDHIENVRPVTAEVTVISAREKLINISSKIRMVEGFTLQDIREKFMNLMDEHLKEIAFKDLYVSFGKVGSILLSTPGVLDYSDLYINNAAANVSLHEEDVPILGAIAMEV